MNHDLPFHSGRPEASNSNVFNKSKATHKEKEEYLLGGGWAMRGSLMFLRSRGDFLAWKDKEIITMRVSGGEPT